MKRLGRWIKKWNYIWIMVLTGMVFVTATGTLSNLVVKYRPGLRAFGEEMSQIWRFVEENLTEQERYYPEPGQSSASGQLTESELNNGPLQQEDAASQEGGASENAGSMPETGENNTDPGRQEVPSESGREETESAGEVEPAEPVYCTVEDDYFEDALFIGDSRTVGMFEYGGLQDTARFCASTGLTVYKMMDAQIVEVPGERRKISAEELLSTEQFGKIYIMIGINEMGTGTVDSFADAYAEKVQRIRELQPDALIYIQGILKVSTERSEQGDYINNEGIVARNEAISRLADNEHIFYLDVNPEVCGEDGGLIQEYTFDGIHLKAKYVGVWKDFLKCHAISDTKNS